MDKTITGYVPAFETYMKTSTKLGPSTQRRYAYEITLFARQVGECSLNTLSPSTLLAWNVMLNEAGAAPGTVGQKHAALRQFFQYLEDFEESEHAGRLLRSMKRLQTPKDSVPRRAPYALEEDQVQKLLDGAGERLGVGVRDRALIHFLWATGVRRAELVTLMVGQVDLPERVATVVGKGDKERVVVFDEPCRRDLTDWLTVRETWFRKPEVDNVFISALGGPLNDVTVGVIVQQAAKAAGLRKEVWPHVFRHSRLTALLNRGMALQDVAEFAGHTNPKTTLGYFHQTPGRLRTAYDQATQGRRRRSRRDAQEQEAEQPDVDSG